MSDNEGANNNELLMEACRSDNLEMLEEVLCSEPDTFNINYTDGVGNTALHVAARNGSTECLDVILFVDGIDVNIANRLEGDTPLHKAAAYSDPEAALQMCLVLVGRDADLFVKNKLRQIAADVAPPGKVKDFLKAAMFGAYVDPRDIVHDDDSDSEGVASDED